MTSKTATWLGGGLVALAVIFIAFIFAPDPSTSGPQFKGRTATEWFDEHLISGYSDDYYEALRQLSTNFFPVFEQACRQYPPKRPTLLWINLYAKLPASVQSFFTKPKPLIDPRPLVDRSMGTFSRHYNQWSTWTNDLSSRLRANSPGRQEITLRMLALLHSGRSLNTDDCRAYVDDKFFPVRFYSALIIAEASTSASVKQSGEAIPEQAAFVLHEALTNRAMMIEIFSTKGARHWQRKAEMALDQMSSVTPVPGSEGQTRISLETPILSKIDTAIINKMGRVSLEAQRYFRER